MVVIQWISGALLRHRNWFSSSTGSPISNISFKVAVPPSSCRGNFHSFFRRHGRQLSLAANSSLPSVVFLGQLLTVFTGRGRHHSSSRGRRGVGSVLSLRTILASILLVHLLCSTSAAANSSPLGKACTWPTFTLASISWASCRASWRYYLWNGGTGIDVPVVPKVPWTCTF